ncbi:MAG: Rrf2 family transcriptional regulator [Candidatus Kapaibacterium sp.]|nr:MAG: Rrf2 family transcriptional regulator [Candidatus Kapabacteria bacterium]
MLSKSCVYGVQAAIYVASLPRNEYVSIQQIATKLNISFHFLTKVLQNLTQVGIMVSYRGPNGGIALARPASSITLADIIDAIDGSEIFHECLFGLPGCGHADPCPAHENWTGMRIRLHQLCKSLTLSELGERANQLNVRLANAPMGISGLAALARNNGASNSTTEHVPA